MDPVISAILIGAAALVAPVVFHSVWRLFWIEQTAVITKSYATKSFDPIQRVVRTFRVEYVYEVDGRRYQGSGTIKITAAYHVEADEIARLTAEFGPGEAIRIYRPRHIPVISSTSRTGGLTDAVFAVFLLLIFIVAGYLYWRAVDTWRPRHFSAAASLKVVWQSDGVDAGPALGLEKLRQTRPNPER